MDRRKFICLVFGSATTGIIVPKLALASSPSTASRMAGGMYHTKDAPGRWAKKIDGHLPNIEVKKDDRSSVVKIVTAHVMDPYAHYIVKHIVLDNDYNFLAEHMFDPIKDKVPISEISVGTYRGVINVLSVCNKHDTWLNIAEI